jgi:hypothetical protein
VLLGGVVQERRLQVGNGDRQEAFVLQRRLGRLDRPAGVVDLGAAEGLPIVRVQAVALEEERVEGAFDGLERRAGGPVDACEASRPLCPAGLRP